MIARLLLFILAVVFLPLGIVFTIVGATADRLDSGDPKDMLVVGLALGAVGLVLTLAFAVLQRREIARRQRRRAGLRTTAEIVDAQLNSNMRSGAKVALRLTVRFVPAGTVSRTLLVLPTSAPAAGARIDVLYDPPTQRTSSRSLAEIRAANVSNDIVRDINTGEHAARSCSAPTSSEAECSRASSSSPCCR